MSKIQPDHQKLISESNAFVKAKTDSVQKLASQSIAIELKQGQTLLRADHIETHCFILIEGSLRLLAEDPTNGELFTVGKVERGDIVGIVDLLRGAPCEAAIARTASKLIGVPLEIIAQLYKTDIGLRESLNKITSSCEGAKILGEVVKSLNPPPENAKSWILQNLQTSERREGTSKRLLSSCIDPFNELVGKNIDEETAEKLKIHSPFDVRHWTWYLSEKSTSIEENDGTQDAITTIKKESKEWRPEKGIDMQTLGLKELKSDTDENRFKVIRGKGIIESNLATLRMVARAYNTPCPVDILEKILEASFERTTIIPIQTMGQLAESMGLQTQVGKVKLNKVDRLELPVMINNKTHYVLLTQVSNEVARIADPEVGWMSMTIDELEKKWGNVVEVVLLKRMSDTPVRQFGWSWFTPVLKRFRWPLVQVLLGSLFIQLFQLANPLLLQQIIDKVVNQSNLSALQVLGAALVAAALFQGLLTAVRTWLLIDTTDRMDLLLGSQVIDKLLRLPLRFFEKRPVGELSQRLSELGTLRGFLTGTAITSALDLLFASIYILIMLLYSPILTAVALGTIPIYITMILFIAPIYRRLIRNQAQYAARTQSHLIETLSGIQTVKAQHFELNSRWRWQEKYSGQIAEGFKSVVIGTTASEVGNFLNQLSSLLIIWVGVFQVVSGELSLGQLIAFRIIAGYVTGPILRLSSLWQGFQQVGISMERLADIVDQIPETGEDESDQISLPPIKGKVKFENLKFRFGKSGPYQIDQVTLNIEPGEFVGIVGQSGSGKSTLMKLLPRLYEPEQGRILIDGYDIDKVRLDSVRQQVGIVPQECLLFEGTIRENIAMNYPEATTEAIIEVSKVANAHDFIMELPDGYGTRIGERGAGLSGGQKQRIAIARTLLQNPNLLVLDEATSALDYETESNVCRNLQEKLKDKTVLFITHRLSTVRKADRIVLMHQGKIEEIGSHEELIEMGGRYATLYAHQDM